jgi:hypothetical protein
MITPPDSAGAGGRDQARGQPRLPAHTDWTTATHHQRPCKKPGTAIGAHPPPHPAGHVRIMALTPGGPRFVQGPEPALSAEPLAARFLNAATALLQLLVGHAT